MGKAAWFKVFHRNSEAFEEIPDNDVGAGFKAALVYFKTGEEPEGLSSLSRVVFALLRGDIDDANREFEERSERNRKNIRSRYDSLPVVVSGNDSLRLGGKPEARGEKPEARGEKQEAFSLGEESPKPQKEKRFVPPTLEEVRAYCQERGNSIDPQRFLDHYQSIGWMRGKSKIKDWKACVRTWEGNESPSTQTGSEGYHAPVYMGQDENGRGIYT